MKDFNIAKYLKENNLGPHGILGNYVDLQPLKEEDDYGNNKPVDEVPYVGTDDRLDGFGDEFDQVDPVSEIEMEEESLLNKMSQEYVAWLEKNNLPKMSADELLYDENIKKTPEQKKYLQMFIDKWEAAEEEHIRGLKNEDDSVNEVSAFEEKLQYYEGEVNDLVYDMMDTTGADKDQVADFFQYISTKIRNQGIF